MLRMLVGGATKGGGRALAPRGGGPKRGSAKQSSKKNTGPKKKPGGDQKKSPFIQDEEFEGFDKPLGYDKDSDDEAEEEVT